ncbi:outer membrane protein [uncultured Enterovirga sp.]|uniref:outer membrane protein n=1 Tax=uncultured Enterovirga sp. TaxID=2026352 RepID=UPI0035CC50DB
MGSLKVYATLAGFLAVATSITTARSADLLPPPPPMPAVESISEDFGGGWYLRGDVGVSKYEGSKFKNPEFPTSVYFGEDFGSGSFAGGGVGYQFNSWFRADITGEYRFSTGIKVRDRDVFFDGFGNLIISNEKSKGDYSAGVFLANAYIDLGTWHGITPFIGGGVGYAYHWLNNFETSTLNVYANPAFGVGVSGGTFRDKDKGDFAWALHAGLSYDVTQNVKLELAYRYLNFGSIRTGVIDCLCGQVYQGLKIKDLESHDVKLGMRWALGGTSAGPAYEPAPLVRRY